MANTYCEAWSVACSAVCWQRAWRAAWPLLETPIRRFCPEPPAFVPRPSLLATVVSPPLCGNRKAAICLERSCTPSSNASLSPLIEGLRIKLIISLMYLHYTLRLIFCIVSYRIYLNYLITFLAIMIVICKMEFYKMAKLYKINKLLLSYRKKHILII